VPIILSGISDMDITPEASRLYPELYAMCIDNEYFTVSQTLLPPLTLSQPFLFWGWIVHAIIESLICAFVPSLFLANASPQTGTYDTFWQGGAMTFTIVVIVVNLKVVSPFSLSFS
jgi:hypothetical protein